MKKMLALLTIALCLLTACAQKPVEVVPEEPIAPVTPETPATPEPPAEPEPEVPETVDVVLYIPNENVDGWEPETVNMELSAENILAALVERQIQPEGTKLLSFAQDENTITVDISQEFGDAISSTGTTGEAILMSSLANSLLEAFGAEEMVITCEGQPVETGHVVYDFPVTFVENY